ncbi:MAG: hypothetical protein WA618_07335 [Terriglobales bacterium]
MPEPVVAPPAAAPPAAPPSAPPSAPSSPSVSLKPPDKGAAVEVPAAKPSEQTSDADLKFDFGFEGEEAATPAIEGEVDYTKPFDPALEELLKNSPEQLKQAKAAWYDNRNWKASGFKSAQELKQHVQKIDQLATGLGRGDGLKGLAAIEAEAKEWSATLKGFQSGDEGVVKQWFSDLKPEVMDRNVATALAQYKEKNGPGWSRTMAQSFMSELRAQNARGESVLTSLNRLADLAKDTPGAMPLLQSIAEAINGIDEISRQAPVAAAPAAKDQEFAQRERALFVRELSGRIMPQIGGAAQKAAKTVLGGRQLGAEATKTFSLEIQTEYNRLTKADKEFQTNAKTYLDANDQEGFERLTRSQISKVMPTAARNINRKYQGFSPQEMQRRQEEGASRVEGAAGGSQAGAKMRYTGKMVQGGPDPASVDWARMRQVAGGKTQAEDMMFDRRFFVKGDTKNEYYW